MKKRRKTSNQNNNNDKTYLNIMKGKFYNNYLFKLILFRIMNALIVDTYFNPDEFWQGPEVAHNIFGYGHYSNGNLSN